jgi:tRNA threonylcarbamoyladenosine biosynthesis protein TsaB
MLLAETVLNVPGTHSDRLLVTVHRALEEAKIRISDLDAFGVVLGPGAFTGLRVGIATVKGLALAAGKPAIGVSSLQALAFQAGAVDCPVSPMLDARKREVYAGLFRWDGSHPDPVASERVIDPDAFLCDLEGDIYFIGGGSEAYRSLILGRLGTRARFAPWPANPLRASSAAALALDGLRQGNTCHLAHLNPVYIRPSEAEIALEKRRANTLIEG